MRLGALPPDPARLAAAPSLMGHTFGILAPLPKLDRSAIDFTPGLYQNDELPDCTAVALANCARAASFVAGGGDMAIDAATVPAFYAESLGKPDTPDALLAATSGVQILTALALQSSAGFDAGQEAPLVALFGTVDHTDRIAIANGMARLGAAYLGVTLYEGDMEMPAVWDTSYTPGVVVGNHALIAWDYTGLRDYDEVRLGSWGAWVSASWGWIDARICEAHGLVWPQFAVTGVDRERLAEDLAGWSTTT